MIGLKHLCTIQKRNRKQKFTISGITGTAVVGQTITGQTSTKTAVIDKVSAAYLVVKTLSGTFTPGEQIKVSTTFTATFGTTSDYQNQSGEYEYWYSNNQLTVPCRFYYSGSSGKGAIIHETGQLLDQPVKCAFPPSVTIATLEYRVVSTVAGFTGTYDITTLYPLNGISGIDHYEAVLKVVA